MPATNTAQVIRRDIARYTADNRTYRAIMAAKLSVLLASTYHLIIKSHLYHWSVIEPVFGSLHEAAEDHYRELRDAGDAIIDRIEELGHEGPQRPTLTPGFGLTPGLTAVSLRDVVDGLAAGHQDVRRHLVQIAALAADAGDIQTSELVDAQSEVHGAALKRLHSVLPA